MIICPNFNCLEHSNCYHGKPHNRTRDDSCAASSNKCPVCVGINKLTENERMRLLVEVL